MNGKIKSLAIILFVFACLLGLETVVCAQGRGRGQGGPPPGAGGPPSGVGVSRGIGTSSDRSNGRADVGRSTASDRSDGRSDAGLNRAALQRENSAQANKDLRDGYQSALLVNPDLKFGQYVAATRLGANLHGRYPNVTTNAILAGLANGNSIGRTLQNLGVGKDDAKQAEKIVDREIKDARR